MEPEAADGIKPRHTDGRDHAHGPCIPCAACPTRRLPAFVAMSPEEVEFMHRFKSGELRVGRARPCSMEGANCPQLFTVLSGMGLRHKLLENGRRQVVNFVLPGDFIGLQAGLPGEMKHSVEAVTPMARCVFNRGELWQVFRAQPERACDLTWIAAVEERLLGETVATLGQRDTTQRIARALSKLHAGLVSLGQGRGGDVPLPCRQQDLADALGLPLVNTNKTLRRLGDRQLAHWADGRLHVPDPEGLATLALTEPGLPASRPVM